MIEIFQPYTYKHNNKTRLEARITASDLTDFKLWYEVDDKYADYLCDELADAFLLAMIPIASKLQEDIHIHSAVSPKLYFSTQNIHLPFYSAFLGKARINVHADEIKAQHFHGSAIATGCSLGVDSMSTILQQTAEGIPEEHRLTHLALFNSCQLGDRDQELLVQEFRKKCEDVEAFSRELGLDCVFVNSNITSLISYSELVPTQLFHYFTASCVLAIQKLFCRYFISSSYDAAYVCVDSSDLSHTESVFVPQLGNENTEIVISDAFVSRVDKTRLIMNSALTPRYLDVCGAIQLNNMGNGYNLYCADKTHKNCGWCNKCLRTLFTIELLGGDLSEYADSFNLEKYHSYRNSFIIKLVAKSKDDIFFNEIYSLMKEKNFPIPPAARAVKLVYSTNGKMFKNSWHKYLNIKSKLLKH